MVRVRGVHVTGKVQRCATASGRMLTLALNGSTISTVTFAAGTAMATFTTTSGIPYLFDQGDVLTLTAPATQDANFADLIGFIALQ